MTNTDDQQAIPAVETPTSRKYSFWYWFFGVIALLFLAQLTLALMAKRHVPSEDMTNAAKQRAYAIVADFGPEVLKDHFPATEQSIEENIDRAFAPVYANIKPFADAHYSVTGEYAELFAASRGTLVEKIQSSLFAGMDARIGHSVQKISKVLGEEFNNVMDKQHAQDKQPATEEQRQALQIAFNSVKQDMLTRFTAQSLMAKVFSTAGGAAAGAVLAKALAAVVAKKLVASLAAKSATKVAAKSASGAGTTAIGAGIGTMVAPGPGTAIGGALGAVVGWFAMDKVMVEADEFLNRDEFEQGLKKLIDEQRVQAKVEIRKVIRSGFDELKGKSPAKLIQGKGDASYLLLGRA